MSDYKNTVFLPKTDFAMRAGLSQKEPSYIEFWNRIKLYEKLRKKSKGKSKFILHYGPPYANGHIHIGHALSEVLKDIVNKTYQMMGYDAPMVPGWDCHGLPIEWKIEETLIKKGGNKDAVSTLEFIKSCREFAQHWVGVQKEEFIRLGIVADWENPYITMEPETEGKIAAEISKFLMNGSLYRGLKPVLWSVVEKTALAEAEVEYKDHTSDSIYVGFPIVQAKNALLQNVKAVIWTTTPWTLPGNRAIAYGDEFTYQVIEITSGTDLIPAGTKLLLAKDLVADFATKTGVENYAILGNIVGTDLKGVVCAHPWRGQGYDFDVPLLMGEHVTTEAGTGLVHTAPGHGMEDFIVGRDNGVEVPETVQGDGTYYAHVPLFAGQHIFKVNPNVIEALKMVGALLQTSKLLHSYPHSWRSKAPLIYRATAQWFVSMENNDLREKALESIERVKWFPQTGKNRIKSMVENRPDWCLSRQRTWGVPIIIFVEKATGTPLRDKDVQERIAAAISKEGIEAWHTTDPQVFLGGKYKADDYEQVKDIADVWFDSACTHAFTLEDRSELAWPADVYFEGSDQHRGWFQSSLLQSCGTRGQAPYKNVVTHGFVLDEKGYKMSKSVGNTIGPKEIIDTLGADLLRLWIVGSDYTDDLRIGKEILKHQEDIYRRLRNTLRYLLGALDGFSEVEKLPYEQMPLLEKWVLHRLLELNKLHQQCTAEFDFLTFYTQLHAFCAVDLSALYFDIRKDTLYCDHANNTMRRATRTVMDTVFNALIRWLAPVLSFTAEEAWLAYTKQETPEESIHEQNFVDMPQKWFDEALAKRFDVIRDLRRVMTGALEVERNAKTIGSSLQADISVYVSPELADVLEDLDLSELAITSEAQLLIAQAPANAFTLDDISDIGVVVNLAEGEKCHRCWKVKPEVGQPDRAHTNLCERCEDVMEA